MTTNLFISLYNEQNKKRQSELKECLLRNCKVFDIVWVLAEGGELAEWVLEGLPTNVNVLPVTIRPTFRTFFNAVNAVTNYDDINVVSNSDIYFEALNLLPGINQCFSITRYENGILLNQIDSQDAWIFKGIIKIPSYCDYHQIPGCDNRLNYELRKMGYEMSNPCLTIKSHHLHKGEKSYDGTKRINPPYLRLNHTY